MEAISSIRKYYFYFVMYYSIINYEAWADVCNETAVRRNNARSSSNSAPELRTGTGRLINRSENGGENLECFAPNNLNGLEVKGVIQEQFGFAAINQVEIDNQTRAVTLLNGFGIEQFYYLRDSLNFSAIPVEGKGWVKLAPNGSLTGMANQVLTGEADISIDSSEFAIYRVQKLQFLHANFQERLYIFFKQPSLSKARSAAYIQNFSPRLWLALGVSFLAIGCAHCVMAKCTKMCRDVKYAMESPSMSDFVMSIFGMICQQGATVFQWNRRITPEKIVLLSGDGMSVILYSGYCATLISVLKAPTPPIRSLQDIKDYNLKVYGDVYTLAAHAALNEFPSTLDLSQRLVEREQAIVEFEHGQVPSAYIAPSYIFNPIIWSEPEYCTRFSKLPLNKGPPNLSGMFVKKGSTFKQPFNQKILEMMEHGFRSRLASKYISIDNTLTCFSKVSGDPMAMELGEVAMGGVILLVGGLLALLVLAGEVLLRKNLKRTLAVS